LIALFALAAAFAAPPVCTPTTVSATPGVPIQLQPTCDQAGTATITTAPIGGTLPGLPGTYTPFPGFNGVDHVLYTITNAGGETSEQTTINIVVNRPPTCADGTAATEMNKPLNLVFPCSDPDGGSVLIRAEDGAHGVVDPHVGNQLTYTPDSGYVGTDEISFVAIEGATETASRTLTVTVTPAATATVTPTATATAPATATPVPTPAATATPDKRAPTLTVKAGKASVAKGVTLTLKSDEAGTAKITLTAGKNTVTKTAKLVNGTAKTALKLSPKARKALKKSVKAKLTVVATDAAGNRATKTLSLTLKR
jgi:large repetitive protein